MTGRIGSSSIPPATAGRPAQREPEEIAKILSRWLSTHRVRERVSEDSIYARWKDVVGEEIAAATRVVRCARGVITVEVSSAPLLTELATYHREDILASIRALEGFEATREIRFRAGST